MKNTVFDLSGKTVLITGGAGLLGIQHAIALHSAGADIVLTDINNNSLDDALQRIAGESGGNGSINQILMDVSSADSVVDVSSELDRRNIRIDVLVNNAAIDPKFDKNNSLAETSRLENFPLDDWNVQIQVGLTGAFLCAREFGRKMASAGGGNIVNIASDLSVIAPDQRLYRKEKLPESHQPVKPVTYSVIKFGLIGLTKYLSTYWLNGNMRCNSLSPGGVFNGQDEVFLSRIEPLIPLGRMAKRNEYHGALQFLCSDASSYMNGHNLVVDGGRSVL